MYLNPRFNAAITLVIRVQSLYKLQMEVRKICVLSTYIVTPHFITEKVSSSLAYKWKGYQF